MHLINDKSHSNAWSEMLLRAEETAKIQKA